MPQKCPMFLLEKCFILTTIVRETLKAGLSSAFNGFATIQKRRTFSSKAGYSLKTQHFIRMRLKTPTVDIAPVKLYPYVIITTGRAGGLH